jgi:hypothetical protein
MIKEEKEWVWERADTLAENKRDEDRERADALPSSEAKRREGPKAANERYRQRKGKRKGKEQSSTEPVYVETTLVSPAKPHGKMDDRPVKGYRPVKGNRPVKGYRPAKGCRAVKEYRSAEEKAQSISGKTLTRSIHAKRCRLVTMPKGAGADVKTTVMALQPPENLKAVQKLAELDARQSKRKKSDKLKEKFEAELDLMTEEERAEILPVQCIYFDPEQCPAFFNQTRLQILMKKHHKDKELNLRGFQKRCSGCQLKVKRSYAQKEVDRQAAIDGEPPRRPDTPEEED